MYVHVQVYENNCMKEHADYLSRYTDVEYFNPDTCYSNNHTITKQT